MEAFICCPHHGPRVPANLHAMIWQNAVLVSKGCTELDACAADTLAALLHQAACSSMVAHRSHTQQSKNVSRPPCSAAAVHSSGRCNAGVTPRYPIDNLGASSYEYCSPAACFGELHQVPLAVPHTEMPRWPPRYHWGSQRHHPWGDSTGREVKGQKGLSQYTMHMSLFPCAKSSITDYRVAAVARAPERTVLRISCLVAASDAKQRGGHWSSYLSSGCEAPVISPPELPCPCSVLLQVVEGQAPLP